MNEMTIKAGAIIEAVIARGDLAQLTPDERAKFYVRTCESVGLNPMTRPFEYITLNGKLLLYARKDATDQLRAIHKVSVTDLVESERDGVFIVTAKVMNGDGRQDAAKGAVSLVGLKGEQLANALMKAETKAKRRATLSICGLGFLDELEIEDIPAAAKGPSNGEKLKSVYASKPIAAEIKAAFLACKTVDQLIALKEEKKPVVLTLNILCQDDVRETFATHVKNLRIDAKYNHAETTDPETGEITDQVVWTEDGERPMTAADRPDPVRSPLNGDVHPHKPDALEGANAHRQVTDTGDSRERPAPNDPLDIPDKLKRMTSKEELLWLDLLKSVAAAAPTTQAMMDLQVEHMGAAQQRKVSSAAWVEAVRIFRERVQYLLDHPVFDAETWLVGDVAGALSAAETSEQLAKVKDTMLIPHMDDLTPDQWRVAVKMYRERLDEISPENILGGG